MECCGSTQLSLSYARGRLNAAAGSMTRVCSKNKAASSRRTPQALAHAGLLLSVAAEAALGFLCLFAANDL
jgi:hypothetical protein